MAKLQVFKEVALPATLAPSAIYFIAPVGSPYTDIYVTDVAGTAYRHTITEANVQDIITANIAAMNDMTVVADIAARDALLPLTIVKLVLVQNATADPTVTAGAASYVWNPASSAWVKLTEYESLDVVVSWGAITGRPTATPVELDAAVQATNLKSPAFTYSGGNLVGVTYADGSTKTLTYSGSQLTRVDLVRGAVTYRKDFNYSGGNLVSVVETVL